VENWPSSALVAARALHFGACMLAFGVWVFDRFIVVPAVASHWRSMMKWLLIPALVAAALSGVWWFALLAVGMSGQALQMNILRLVWKQTHFGQLWQLRLIFLILAAIAPVFSRWFALIAGGLLLGSLAWAGHGRTEEWTAGHLIADTVHLLAAGCWPVGLVPFGLLLHRLKRSVEQSAISELTTRFSGMSLICVSVLTASGLVNTWVLLGSVSNLWQTVYGRVLLIKISIFCVMVSIGAVNLLRLKPRLAAGDGGAVGQLRLNVTAEILLGMVVITVVALLGLLPPAL
jgi:copper resistance protein D